MLFTVYLPQIDHLYDPFYWPYVIGYSTCLGLFVGSILAHMLHSRDELSHYVFFSIDYAGIGLYGVGTGLQHYYYSGDEWFYGKFTGLYLPVMVVLSICSCWVSGYYKVKCNRPYPIIRKIAQVGSVASMYLWILVPLANRVYGCLAAGSTLAACDPNLVIHVKELSWFLCAGLFYATNFPESVWPGCFDILGHGHQVFHVCIFATAYYGSEAAFADMRGRRGAEALGSDHYPPVSPHLLSSLWPVLAVLTAEAAIISLIARIATTKIRNQKKDR